MTGREEWGANTSLHLNLILLWYLNCHFFLNTYTYFLKTYSMSNVTNFFGPCLYGVCLFIFLLTFFNFFFFNELPHHMIICSVLFMFYVFTLVILLILDAELEM